MSCLHVRQGFDFRPWAAGTCLGQIAHGVFANHRWSPTADNEIAKHLTNTAFLTCESELPPAHILNGDPFEDSQSAITLRRLWLKEQGKSTRCSTWQLYRTTHSHTMRTLRRCERSNIPCSRMKHTLTMPARPYTAKLLWTDSIAT